MVYLGVNSNNGSSSSSGQNKNGSRSPDLVDIDTDKPNDRNGGNYLCNLFREKNYYVREFLPIIKQRLNPDSFMF